MASLNFGDPGSLVIPMYGAPTLQAGAGMSQEVNSAMTSKIRPKMKGDLINPNKKKRKTLGGAKFI